MDGQKHLTSLPREEIIITMRERLTMTEALRKRARDEGALLPIAEQAKMEKASLYRFVRGDTSLRLDIADRLAEVLGVEVRLVAVPKPKEGK